MKPQPTIHFHATILARDTILALDTMQAPELTGRQLSPVASNREG